MLLGELVACALFLWPFVRDSEQSIGQVGIGSYEVDLQGPSLDLPIVQVRNSSRYFRALWPPKLMEGENLFTPI